MSKPAIPNAAFFDCGPDVEPTRSAVNAHVGDLAIVRVSYLAYTRGQVVRLIRRKGADWQCQYVNHVEGDWTGPDGVVRHCDNQTPLYSATSLELLTEAEYAKYQTFKDRLLQSVKTWQSLWADTRLYRWSTLLRS